MRDRKFGKKSRRAAAAGLAAVMTILSAVPAETGLAAEPAVSVDETMYVNLDYYGAKTGVSVVKGRAISESESSPIPITVPTKKW